MNHFTPNPKTDLVLERVVEVSPAQVWAAWTEPELLMQWFCPLPWKTVACKIDLRPGGQFHTVMQGPEAGQEIAGTGCILEVVKNERLIWTDALGPDYRPNDKPFFTGMLLLEPHGAGTKYTAIGIHKDEATANQHKEMGFHQGWGTALDQLVALMKNHKR